LSLGIVAIFSKPISLSLFSHTSLFNTAPTSQVQQPCLAITQISLCAASSLVFPSVDFVTSATASAPCAIPTCDLRRLSGSAMNAPSATTRTSVLSAVVRVSVMPSIVSSVRD
jgi:hypothetical protein